MKFSMAIFFYVAAFIFIYTALQIPGADAELSHGFPHSTEGYTAAMMLIIGMTSKLVGHVTLFASARN